MSLIKLLFLRMWINKSYQKHATKL